MLLYSTMDIEKKKEMLARCFNRKSLRRVGPIEREAEAIRRREVAPSIPSLNQGF